MDTVPRCCAIRPAHRLAPPPCWTRLSAGLSLRDFRKGSVTGHVMALGRLSITATQRQPAEGTVQEVPLSTGH